MIRRYTLAVLSMLVLAAGCSVRRDTHERLNGVLWMQTSAEYQALIAVTYRQATARVLDLAKQMKAGRSVPSAALEQPGSNTRRLRPAVVVDIDETLLDNSPVSSELIERREGWNGKVWTDWVEMRRADFMRGAKAFVDAARHAGVEVFFVTNRKASEEACTIEDLQPLVVTDAQLLASEEKDPKTGEVWKNEKQGRRAAIARDWWIIALVGDDLADFIPNVRESVTPGDRVHEMEKHLARFGDRWFLLPNPVYGSWETSVVDPRETDAEQLLDKHRKIRRFPADRERMAPCEPAPKEMESPDVPSTPAS